MPKTLTLRVDDKIYAAFKSAAEKERRSISNFLENAAMEYIELNMYVDNNEMNDILEHSNSIKRGLKQASKGKYKIVR